MKKIRVWATCLVAIMVLTSCGGGEGGTAEPSGNTYSAELELPARASEQIVTLDKLSSNISNIQSSDSWLTVEQQSYTSGAPKVKMRWTENTTMTARKCIITVTASTNDRLIINITQKGKVVDTDGSHDTKTDQPAY